MWTSLLRYSLLLLVCHLVHCLAPLPTPVASRGYHNATTDQRALLYFKSLITDDPSEALASWNKSIHFCQWRGIVCGRRHPDRVTALDLGSLALAGSVSPFLANLTFLRRLYLPNNRFHWRIPHELGLLSRLQHLDLSMNALEGEIPASLGRCSDLTNLTLMDNNLQGEIPTDLGRCPNLQIIGLQNNLLQGGIPSELSSLSALSILDLSNNSLSGHVPSSLVNASSLAVLNLYENRLSGHIPPSLANLSSLFILDLSFNGLSGVIPPTLGKLSKLDTLDLLSNNLTGTIPQSLWNLSSLTLFDLSWNQLFGTLPMDLGLALPLLQVLSMDNNQFHGSIPVSLSNASGLQAIQLANNEFSGSIPSNVGILKSLAYFSLHSNRLEAKEANDWIFLTALANCTDLQVLQLGANKLGGTLPSSIANLSTGLQVLTMQDNQISGSIPPGVGNLVNLTIISMTRNLLTGIIPYSIGLLQNLGELGFESNNLTGEIPSSLGNLTQLIKLYLDFNSLSGRIPISLGKCTNLEILSLGFNKLTGVIPREVVSISTISQFFNLQNNLLTGTIPVEVGSLQNLQILDISENKFFGEIPSTLGECLLLEDLYMGGNHLNGTIPSSLSTLKGIQQLDLSRNNLSGRVPEFLEDFHALYYLNLSFNNFEGELPKDGVFANVSALSISGNDKLCGGNPKLHLPPCPLQIPRKKHSSSLLAVAISISGSFLCLILLACYFAIRWWIQKSRRKRLASASMKDQHMRISYAELMKATDGFSAANLIGVGSFGSVYKGIVDSNDSNERKIVAVKVLNLQQRGASKSFMAECEALRNIRHRNLIKILTVCSSQDYRGNDFKALVYEFMSNGSLENWLHPEISGQQSISQNLNLVQRLNIAIDVASALDYLHNHGGTPVVHCDLKPSNVLIDDDMVAHVGDFGLARFLIKTESKSSQNSTSSAGLKGTVGYVAPEYGMANRVSTCGDIYSYGILLLEMFTGKRPTDETFEEGLSLPKYVERAFSEQVLDVLDARLLSDDEDGEDSSGRRNAYEARVRIQECVASTLRIGLSCSKELPTERMKMENVISELQAIRDASCRTGLDARRRHTA